MAARNFVGFLSMVGILSIFLVIGTALILAMVHALVAPRYVEGPKGLLKGVLAASFPLAVGFGIVAAPVAGMWERYGLAGVAVLLAQYAAALSFYFWLPAQAPPSAARRETSGRRPDPPLARRLVAAVPSLATSLAFAATLLGLSLPWPNRDDLGGILAVEFLVLAFAGLLAPLALLRLDHPRADFARWYAFGALLLFTLGPVATGPELGLSYLLALLATYGGAAATRRSDLALAAMLKRLAVSFVAFLLVTLVFRPPEQVQEWADTSRGLALGAAYFFVLAGCELFGVYGRRWLGSMEAQAGQ